MVSDLHFASAPNSFIDTLQRVSRLEIIIAIQLHMDLLRSDDNLRLNGSDSKHASAPREESQKYQSPQRHLTWPAFPVAKLPGCNINKVPAERPQQWNAPLKRFSISNNVVTAPMPLRPKLPVQPVRTGPILAPVPQVSLHTEPEVLSDMSVHSIDFQFSEDGNLPFKSVSSSGNVRQTAVVLHPIPPTSQQLSPIQSTNRKAKVVVDTELLNIMETTKSRDSNGVKNGDKRGTSDSSTISSVKRRKNRSIPLQSSSPYKSDDNNNGFEFSDDIAPDRCSDISPNLTKKVCIESPKSGNISYVGPESGSKISNPVVVILNWENNASPVTNNAIGLQMVLRGIVAGFCIWVVVTDSSSVGNSFTALLILVAVMLLIDVMVFLYEVHKFYSSESGNQSESLPRISSAKCMKSENTFIDVPFSHDPDASSPVATIHPASSTKIRLALSALQQAATAPITSILKR